VLRIRQQHIEAEWIACGVRIDGGQGQREQQQ
jgi:hypothetical protein